MWKSRLKATELPMFLFKMNIKYCLEGVDYIETRPFKLDVSKIVWLTLNDSSWPIQSSSRAKSSDTEAFLIVLFFIIWRLLSALFPAYRADWYPANEAKWRLKSSLKITFDLIVKADLRRDEKQSFVSCVQVFRSLWSFDWGDLIQRKAHWVLQRETQATWVA